MRHDPRMLDTRLVQRLKTPMKLPGDGPGGLFRDGLRPHHVFGGSQLGLTREAWSVLDPIFEVDYMGAAEYEFGILPDTLRTIAKAASDYIAFSFQCKATRVNVRRTYLRGRLPDPTPSTVYVLCHRDHGGQVPGRVMDIARNKFFIKGSHHVDAALDPLGEDNDLGRIKGWLELNNRFFFFTDEAMWRGTCELFGVATDIPSGVRPGSLEHDVIEAVRLLSEDGGCRLAQLLELVFPSPRNSNSGQRLRRTLQSLRRAGQLSYSQRRGWAVV